ncbi:MAG: LacI family transcriptional regulator [Bifidobacteriaceae bacterium]|jgi:DNA-binding LacI/PurR family transcriptional regulator|nr:LacI family transcriptional regulator [Bifidobacteriaceae bacterium]
MSDPVTLDQVAKAAGVSRTTASRVINGGTASQRSIQAVNRAIDQLGFVPNRAARTLARQRTDQIAIITPESPELIFLDPFIAVITATVSRRLWQAGLQPLLALSDPDDPVCTTKHFLHHSNVDGIIVAQFHRDDHLEALLQELDLPMVFIGRPPDSVPAPYADADNIHGGHAAAKHLLDQGRRHIACLSGALNRSSAVDRKVGFLRAHEEAGVEPGPCVELDFHSGAPAIAVARLLEQSPQIDAIFAQSDFLASGALQALAVAGRSVPDDVAVVGYDDSVTATQVVPNLTTVAQPVAQLGAAAAELMVERLRTGGWGPWPRVFPTELVIRQSA